MKPDQPDPRALSPARGTGRAALPLCRPALFDTDERGLSDQLQGAMALANLVGIKGLPPRAEALIFLHRVTGLRDVRHLRDAYGRITGACGRASANGARMFIKVRPEGL